jgi:hypothetical protein
MNPQDLFPRYENDPLLTCYEPEEWQWWVEELMLTGKPINAISSCLFCRAFNNTKILCTCYTYLAYRDLGGGLVCDDMYKTRTEKILAGWGWLKRAGVL